MPLGKQTLQSSSFRICRMMCVSPGRKSGSLFSQSLSFWPPILTHGARAHTHAHTLLQVPSLGKNVSLLSLKMHHPKSQHLIQMQMWLSQTCAHTQSHTRACTHMLSHNFLHAEKRRDCLLLGWWIPKEGKCVCLCVCVCVKNYSVLESGSLKSLLLDGNTGSLEKVCTREKNIHINSVCGRGKLCAWVCRR